jgi:hypothetical protein
MCVGKVWNRRAMPSIPEYRVDPSVRACCYDVLLFAAIFSYYGGVSGVFWYVLAVGALTMHEGIERDLFWYPDRSREQAGSKGFWTQVV